MVANFQTATLRGRAWYKSLDVPVLITSDVTSLSGRLLEPLTPFVKRFRGGLVIKAHRLVYHSTLGLRVIKKKKKIDPLPVSGAGERGGGRARGALGVNLFSLLVITLKPGVE